MYPGLRSKATATISALIVALALAGCGGSKSQSQATTTPATSATQSTSTSTTESTTTSTSTSSSTDTSEKVPDVNISMASPVNREPVSARYTCDGENVSLPISWSKIPADTVEIDLFIFDLQPAAHNKLTAEWAVAGLKPSLRKLAAGELPAGAVVGLNSSGETRYSICPRKGPAVRYIALVYALPTRIPAQTGFNPEALREKALHTAKSLGLLGITYKRH